jgi:hypothetical protein
LLTIESLGRLAWQGVTGYGRRALVETTMSRYKSNVGARLRARSEAVQRTEVATGAAVLNRMLAAAWPKLRPQLGETGVSPAGVGAAFSRHASLQQCPAKVIVASILSFFMRIAAKWIG